MNAGSCISGCSGSLRHKNERDKIYRLSVVFSERDTGFVLCTDLEDILAGFSDFFRKIYAS